MTPIESVKPALPGNWTRRPEAKIKRGEAGPHRKPHDKNRSRPAGGHSPGEDPGEREHIVDELA